VVTYSHARQGRLLDALGDPTRRAIFEHLGERPSAVVDLAARLPVSRPAVSQHLKVLKDAGLVSDLKVGARRVYSLDPEGLAELRDYMDRFWNTALHSFKVRVEQPIVGTAPAANSPAANSPAANSPAANSPAANSPAANSPAANSPAANSKEKKP
jgi:DNA-binding transcriptional ArsR family regulator